MKTLLFNLRKHDKLHNFYEAKDVYLKKPLFGVFSIQHFSTSNIANLTIHEKILLLDQYSSNNKILSVLSKDQDYVIKTIACCYGSSLSFCLSENCFYYPIFLIEAIFRNKNFTNNHLIHIYNNIKSHQYHKNISQDFIRSFYEIVLNCLMLKKHNDTIFLLKELCHSNFQSIRSSAFLILKNDYKEVEKEFIKKTQIEYNYDSKKLSFFDFNKLISTESRFYIIELLAENPYLPKSLIPKLLSFKNKDVLMALSSNISLNFKQKKYLLEKDNLQITESLLNSLETSEKNRKFLEKMYTQFYKHKIRGSISEQGFLSLLIKNKNTSKYIIDDIFLNPLINPLSMLSSFVKNKNCPIKLLEEASKDHHIILILEHQKILDSSIIKSIYNTLIKHTMDSNYNVISKNTVIRNLLKLTQYSNCPLNILWALIKMNDIKDYFIDYYGDFIEGEEYYNTVIKKIKKHPNYLNEANALIKMIDELN